MSGLLGVVVPAPIQFLNWGWWIIHVIGITVVFLIGMTVGKTRVGMVRYLHADGSMRISVGRTKEVDDPRRQARR